MAAIKLGQLYGGGGFATSSFSTQQTLSSGLSGDILTLTAPIGKKVRLDSLKPTSGNTELGMTVTVDGVDVVTNRNCGPSSDSVFSIGKHLVGASFEAMDDIIGNEIVVKKVSGVTTWSLVYSYSFGE